ncbi:hypothetical protein [Hyphomicrobium sp.]|uniref:hypothetical protein n=1 Tax=Hyphomicrobium sp. TaxID=82 RepID=UPI0025C72916|nr:hypothetical protein [Hyphomicrobium sp.]MCC7253009.1 hypothetical protein [Hyphomicrobium sp.]
MSLRAIPLTIIAFVLYNVVVLFSGLGTTDPTADGGQAARALLATTIFSVKMISGGTWDFTWGDLILLVTLIILFVEIVKATYTSASGLIDHGLSMLVFVAVLIEFLVVPQAATSVFFLLLIALLIDVVAGAIISIRVARRDIGFGGIDH